MSAERSNLLLSTSKTSDSRLSVQVHPLVLLTISDYITRHILRQQHGPIVGAILGSQNGREITLEHAFECLCTTVDGGDVVLDPAWFADRLQQYKEVHKAPPLDLVGWFTICPLSGPQPQHLPIHRQLLDQHNESSIFLAFHPDTIADGTSQGGKLPFTIYESIYEAASDEDKHMHESDESQKLALRFKELPYTIETGEAEMIAVDFVAKGGANAASRQAASWPSKEESDGKGKKRSAPDGEVKTNANGVVEQDYLRPEDDDQIASLTGKANAIRMLQKRLTLIKKYLQSVPPCYLNDASQATMEPNPHIQHSVLRSIAALLARLPLLTPSTPAANDPTPGALAYGRESAAEASDVALISLLASLGDTLSIAKRMGAKASVLEAGKHTRGQEKFSNSFSSSFSSRNALDASFATDDVDEGIDATMSY